jgi:hypothetical protein
VGHALAFAIAVTPVVALVRNPPVWRLDEVRPVLVELHRQRRPGDVVFAYYPAWQALRYYGPLYGLPPESVELATCHPSDLHDYLRDLDHYRGLSRFWFLTSFNVPSLGEIQAMVEYLDAIGVRRETITAPPNNRPGRGSSRVAWEKWRPTAAYLYDLSDPARLASATAADRSLPPPIQFRGVPRCVYGPLIPHRATASTSSAARPE